MSRPFARRIALALALQGCGGSLIERVDAPPPPPAGATLLQIDCTPADAELYVNDRFFGRLDGYRQGRIPMRPGRHRLSLQKPGFAPWYGLVTVGDAEGRLEIRLAPKP